MFFFQLSFCYTNTPIIKTNTNHFIIDLHPFPCVI